MNRPVSTLAFALFVVVSAVTAHAQFMPKKDLDPDRRRQCARGCHICG